MTEKNKLKKEMLRKVKETKLSLLAMTEDQLHTTTKRTIMENEQMTTELQYQSRVAERLVKQNEQLLKDHRTMKRQIELHQDAERLLATRTGFFQRVIKKLNERVKELEEQCSLHSQPNSSKLSGDGASASHSLDHEDGVLPAVAAASASAGLLEAGPADFSGAAPASPASAGSDHEMIDPASWAAAGVQAEVDHLRGELARLHRVNQNLKSQLNSAPDSKGDQPAAEFVLRALEDAKQTVLLTKASSSAPSAPGVNSKTASPIVSIKLDHLPQSWADLLPAEREAILRVLYQKLRQSPQMFTVSISTCFLLPCRREPHMFHCDCVAVLPYQEPTSPQAGSISGAVALPPLASGRGLSRQSKTPSKAQRAS